MVDGWGDKFRLECDFKFASGSVGVLDSHPAVVHLQGLAGRRPVEQLRSDWSGGLG